MSFTDDSHIIIKKDEPHIKFLAILKTSLVLLSRIHMQQLLYIATEMFNYAIMVHDLNIDDFKFKSPE